MRHLAGLATVTACGRSEETESRTWKVRKDRRKPPVGRGLLGGSVGRIGEDRLGLSEEGAEEKGKG